MTVSETETSLAGTMRSNVRHSTATRMADPMKPNQDGAPIGVPTTIPSTTPTVKTLVTRPSSSSGTAR